MLIRISWTGLQTHELCKQKGYLSRTGKKATLTDQRVFFPGTITDLVVRNWLRDDPRRNLGAMPSMVRTVMAEEEARVAESGGQVRWKNLDDRAQVEADCIEGVTKIEPALMKFVVPFEYEVDKRFEATLKVPNLSGELESITLVGAMDILVSDRHGRWWVWDVKQTRNDDYWRKTKGQLVFYDLAVQLLFGQPTVRTGLLQPLCKKPVLPFEITDGERAEIRQRVIGMAQDMWSSNYPTAETTAPCGFCNVRHACPRFKPIRNANGERVLSFG